MGKFPANFLWGAATSAYQVEGDNRNCDWWEWEQRSSARESSGRACRSYELFAQDFDIARSLHHNAHRFSVEWSRIEPQEGVFSEQEIAHYREVVRALKERGIAPVVTLHHFTNPLWFARMGGWEHKKASGYFLRFVEKIVNALSEDVRYWVTINEPMVYVYQSYILGAWPPQERSFARARRVAAHLLDAHVEAYRKIHRLYQEKHNAPVAVSIAQNIQAFVPCRPTLLNRAAACVRDRLFNYGPLARLARAKALDFIGINYYTRSLVEVRGVGMRHFLLDTCARTFLPRNSLGWETYPEGLYDELMRLERFKLPIFILENGICTSDDRERADFILRHLTQVQRAVRDGAPVIGYLCWSLLDNYEWDKGFAPRFGLVEVDYTTFKRTVRGSALRFAEVCLSGEVPA